MPPRSVCLNVFTTSLGDRNEAVTERREKVMDGKRENEGRHEGMERRDSAQSCSDVSSVAATPTTEATFNLLSPPTAPSTLQRMASVETMSSSFLPKPCATCSGNPAKLRCSRCKIAHYCDRTCQKSDWKRHRNECEAPAVSLGFSAPVTPNVSTPASPINE